MRSHKTLISFALFLLLPAFVFAVDSQVSYVAIGLTNSTGGLFNGTLQVNTSLYDAESGGNLLQTQNTSVEFESGNAIIIFNLTLSDIYETFWIEANVSGELQDRFKYTPAAQALAGNQSNRSDYWDGLDTPDDITGLDSDNIASVNWTTNQNYPAACPENASITELGDSVTCTLTNSMISTLDFDALSLSGTVDDTNVNNAVTITGGTLGSNTISSLAVFTITDYLVLAGDVNITGGVNVTGTVTANGFVGDLTGDVTGNADTATTATEADDLSASCSDCIGGAEIDESSLVGVDATTLAGQAASYYTNTSGISGENITSGTVADARIASTIARDSEYQAADATQDECSEITNCVVGAITSWNYQWRLNTSGNTSVFTANNNSLITFVGAGATTISHVDGVVTVTSTDDDQPDDDSEVPDSITVDNGGTVDADALGCDVGDDDLISEDCIGDVLDAGEIEDIYVLTAGDTMDGDLIVDADLNATGTTYTPEIILNVTGYVRHNGTHTIIG